jgi:hypothetical protein
MRATLILVACLATLSLAPAADAWPPVCMEYGADVGVVDVGVIANCGLQPWATVCVPNRACHDLIP